MKRYLTLAATALALVAAPRPAAACGGFFCSSSPIEQAGETIVYGLEDDGTVTMSVQIRYAGDDDDFAWILPVPAPPEISIGSDALFTALRNATEPVFVTGDERTGVCRRHPTCYTADCDRIRESSGCGYSSGAGPEPWTGPYVDASAAPPPPARADAGGLPSGDAGGGVTVYSQGPVGPYDTAVLGAATASEVLEWLADHGYDIPESSHPLLESYAEAGQIFVALRLSSNRDTRFIQPVTLRMPIEEACLPIRLTAIASVPDLPITAFFLGRERVAPRNYSLAEPAVDDLAFFEGRRRWEDAARAEVEALGGQAFVTDYAGPTPAVSLTLPSVDDLATAADPAYLVQELGDRGFAGNPRLLELFRRHLSPPEGAVDVDYYNCLSTRTIADCGEPSHFDPEALARDVEASIVAPRREAEALVHRHGYLTRLWTTLSVEKMTLDPVFAADAGLDDVSNVHEATLVTECSDSYYEEDAPRHWVIGDSTIPDRDGRRADDEAYCESRGGSLERRDCPEPSSSGGCLCGVAGAAPIEGGVLGGLLLVFLVRRRRHS